MNFFLKAILLEALHLVIAQEPALLALIKDEAGKKAVDAAITGLKELLPIIAAR
jgi:hypothetical protein